MGNHTTGAQRRNKRMDKIFDDAKKAKALHYFTGTPAQARLIADYLLWTYNEERHILTKDYPINLGDENPKIIEDLAGDTAVRALYEDDEVLIYLSIDSCIKVVVTIDKEDFSKSQSIEL